jgi:hypothetical protein
MGSMQCNVEFGYQLIICSGTKKNHGKPMTVYTLEQSYMTTDMYMPSGDNRNFAIKIVITYVQT